MWFQVFLSNTNNFQTGTTIPDESGPGRMSMKECPTLLRAPELASHHRVWFSVILKSPFFDEIGALSRGYSQQNLRPRRSVYKGYTNPV